jgi:hypothetical protein
MTTANPDLTLDICSVDGARTQFYQSDPDHISNILDLLITSRIFTQPLLTLASERSTSFIPVKTIALILIRTPTTPPLLLPPGWLDVVEVGAEALLNGNSPNNVNNTEVEGVPTAVQEATLYVEIHTLGEWMIILRLQTAIQPTILDQRQLLAHFFDLPVIPFRLETGGVGLINPIRISRVTVYSTFKGLAEVALPVDLLRWTPAFQKKGIS